MEEQNRNKETAPGEARRPSSVEEAEAAIEAVLFAMGDSVELGRIAKAIGHDTETTRRILNHMMEKYNIPEDEAKKYMQYTDEPIDDVDD